MVEIFIFCVIFVVFLSSLVQFAQSMAPIFHTDFISQFIIDQSFYFQSFLNFTIIA